VNKVVVTGSFDGVGSRHIRFLEQASKLGDLDVLLWADDVAELLEGKRPKFSQAERQYVLEAVRYVTRVVMVAQWAERDALPHLESLSPAVWAVNPAEDCPAKRRYCAAHGMAYHVVAQEDPAGFPSGNRNLAQGPSAHRKVMITGAFDWFHSGHVRFFEEASELGDLYVVVGHDANIALLKGAGHPMFPQEERRYVVQSIRYVKQALISTGRGWLDAEPEIVSIRPDVYAVNEDGDRPEKQDYCEKHGIEYLVLKRVPKEGLPKRDSTTLRGF